MQAVVLSSTEVAVGLAEARSRTAAEVGDPSVTQKADPDSTRAVFGANEWLVDELYEQYQKDKNSVDPAWWDFFEGYKPEEASDQRLDPGETAPAHAGPPRSNGTRERRRPPPRGSHAAAGPPLLRPRPRARGPRRAPAGQAAPFVEPPAVTSPIATAQPATAPYAQVAQRASRPTRPRRRTTSRSCAARRRAS